LVKKFYYQSGRIKIASHVEKIGEDIKIEVFGGKPHIGATALAYPSDKENCITKTIIAGNHKEGPLAEQMAEKICRSFHRTTLVMMGIHYEKISKAEIRQIIEYANSLSLKIINDLKNDLFVLPQTQ
jgi:metal-dependent hydrolase (beta-lactamase superfamily II)